MWLKSLGGALVQLYRGVLGFFRVPTPDEREWRRRITIMERDIVLPIKAAGFVMLCYSFYFTPWIRNVSSALDMEVEATQYFFWLYVLVNVLVGVGMLNLHRLPFSLVQWVVFVTGLMDGIFLSTLIVVTGGYNSILYWLFLGLIVRSAVSVPRATSQIMLNLTLSACYLLAGFVDVLVARNLVRANEADPDVALAVSTLRLSEEYPAEPVFLRLALLLLMTACCFGIQVVLGRQRQAAEEAREFALREGQLRSAGRLAAEFVHQMKNPLAIINTAAFSLERTLKQGRGDPTEQIRIIQEEVERSDRIITQVMGYARLSEGRVEKLDILEELERAVERVFPQAAGYPVQVHKHFAGPFPPLLMQRSHVSEALVNLLTNAREALEPKGGGNVHVHAECRSDYAVEIAVQDDGPGIGPDRHERIFEAYYTTKEKGTGLGLATVKNNVELYGGTVRVESELGKGARFTLTFPARSMVRLASGA